MADKRITDVDFIESLNGSESFFINQNSSIKQVAFKDTAWNIANGGTGASNAADARTNLGIIPENIGAQKKHVHTTVTLASNGWSDNKQTIIVSGVTDNNTVITSPAPSSYFDYADYGIYCSAQATDRLTFNCDYVPNVSIAVNVAIFE